jgi:hypothetical protein
VCAWRIDDACISDIVQAANGYLHVLPLSADGGSAFVGLAMQPHHPLLRHDYGICQEESLFVVIELLDVGVVSELDKHLPPIMNKSECLRTSPWKSSG